MAPDPLGRTAISDLVIGNRLVRMTGRGFEQFDWGDLLSRNMLRLKSDRDDVMLVGYQLPGQDHVVVQPTAPVEYFTFDGIMYNERGGLFLPASDTYFRFDNTKPVHSFERNHWKGERMKIDVVSIVHVSTGPLSQVTYKKE